MGEIVKCAQKWLKGHSDLSFFFMSAPAPTPDIRILASVPFFVSDLSFLFLFLSGQKCPPNLAHLLIPSFRLAKNNTKNNKNYDLH